MPGSSKGGRQLAQLREFGDREAVQTEPEHIVSFLGSLDNLLQLIEDVTVQIAEQHPVDV
jgi:hypothetical protein